MVSLLEGWGYHVSHRVLDTRKQGIPQSRPRFYLVEIQRRAMAHQFDFPEDIDPEPIEDFLEDEDGGFERLVMNEAALNVCRRGLEKWFDQCDPSQEPCFVDVFSTQAWSASMRGVSPCLTATRCKQGGHFISTRRGLMTLPEMCRLQCIPPPPGRFKPFSERRFLEAMGNAMSANVLARFLAHVLRAASLSAHRIEPPKGFARFLKG